MTIYAQTAYLGKGKGWTHKVRLHIQDGSIVSITEESGPQSNDVRVDVLLPALANLHSHAFQRAMAGMTEYRAAGADSFWTWRQLMYQFLNGLNPDHVESISALVQMEMLEAGYACVGEFHYLHHQPGGQKYDVVSEMSQRILSAANRTGIGMTLLPVLYTYGGANGQALSGGQKRFACDVDLFNLLVEEMRACAGLVSKDTQVGIAPHSLRATVPEDLTRLVNDHQQGPIHIHIAEQPQEVAEIKAWLGARPVEWLLHNVPVNQRWCLVHATHMSETETVNMARSGAVAGLCPITEANLGDGAFNGAAYLESGGVFGIGSDSNVRISLTEELRTLEYSQRLRDLARNVLVVGEGSVGAQIYRGAAAGGARALNRDSGEIRVGALADLVAIDRKDPSLMALADGQLFDGLCFAASDRVITDVWSAGRHMVRNGRHISRDEIIADYSSTMSSLINNS